MAVKKKKKSTNYLNNASLIEEIMTSKRVQKKNPKWTPAQCMTPKLVGMLQMLVDRYSQKTNWRGYCVDEQTECLTKRGWLNIDQITTEDKILSYSGGHLVWSEIESIFRSPYEGDMFRLTVQGMDALVTPGHKFITNEGLKKVEYLKEKDKVILMGDTIQSPTKPIYTDAFVELVGWVVTEGNYYLSEDRNYTRITVYQNEGEYSDRIRKCLESLGQGFSEYSRVRSVGERAPAQVAFHFRKELCNRLIKIAPNRVPSMKFLLSLTPKQRCLLIDTMVDGDGWRTNGVNYTQACKDQIDSFVSLCTLSGYRTSVSTREPTGFGKKSTYVVRVFSSSSRCSMVENIDFHGGKNTNRIIGQPKETYPNHPTEYYNGRVWCPKTEHGCFMARRNGCVYLTGNTYIDDMRSEAIVSLMQNALKFNPEKSQNPFGYYTQIVTHSFLTFLDKEKKVRRIKDTLMEQQGFTPSHARQLENDQQQQHNRAMATIYPEIVEAPQLSDAEIKEMSKKPKDPESNEPKRKKRAIKKRKKNK